MISVMETILPGILSLIHCKVTWVRLDEMPSQTMYLAGACSLCLGRMGALMTAY
ncbi:hypothetical protein UC8_28460 [Roseimaritima ulvae]|uniref:Uncharacterized protein n=1 Tax=Roseimaritima ulvae TaxID=980254 RepID=A0A5B9QP80_9BACT|nr:hypothetical protein UC8_28460 [Roseimaritima ulvae]